MKMNQHFFKATFLTAMIGLTISTSIQAQTLSREEVIASAMELCQQAAQKRYGDGSVKSVGRKAKWSKGLNGAAVMMKIKPNAKKARKYNCVVGTDSSTKFYKA